jgi:nitric oxide reductase large subunit
MGSSICFGKEFIMGSGDRIKYGLVDDMSGIGLGFSVSRFPFSITVHLHLVIFWVAFGFGKGYDQ